MYHIYYAAKKVVISDLQFIDHFKLLECFYNQNATGSCWYYWKPYLVGSALY